MTVVAEEPQVLGKRVRKPTARVQGNSPCVSPLVPVLMLATETFTTSEIYAAKRLKRGMVEEDSELATVATNAENAPPANNRARRQ